MGNIFAWASIDEHGHAAGGAAGNQTGRELKIGSYYYFGQTDCIRFKDISVGRRAASIMKKLVECQNIGYDQAQRTTLYNVAAHNNWNFNQTMWELKKSKVECDCSSLVATVINLSVEKRIVPCFNTGTIKDTINYRYLYIIPIKDAERRFRKGDAPFKPYKHVIMNI